MPMYQVIVVGPDKKVETILDFSAPSLDEAREIAQGAILRGWPAPDEYEDETA